MPENLLILHPAEPHTCISEAEILEVLREIGLADDEFDWQGERHFRPGERYLQLITFLGCSPVVSLGEPGVTGDEFAHLAIEVKGDHPVLMAGSNIKQPRCPKCRERVTSVQENSDWHCPACAHETTTECLDWRQSAGFGRIFVKIWGVFEGEAVPSDELLRRLEAIADTPWKYFYLRR
ncbi:hypothetical protein [Thiohalomonas denitrificans]|uniref:hypothetical protein n=1 Tax=Thiohalomonas denitrificans TaxID=415747 RepID=UPI0026F25F01|nr:hypothetical protein [Thiohalomonas denitrificans]